MSVELKEGYSLRVKTNPIFGGAEVLCTHTGAEIGEVFQDDDEWGGIHYELDHEFEELGNKQDAIDALQELHDEFLQNLRRKIKIAEKLKLKLEKYK